MKIETNRRIPVINGISKLQDLRHFNYLTTDDIMDRVPSDRFPFPVDTTLR